MHVLFLCFANVWCANVGMDAVERVIDGIGNDEYEYTLLFRRLLV
jgi:hypothetical protein